MDVHFYVFLFFMFLKKENRQKERKKREEKKNNYLQNMKRMRMSYIIQTIFLY